MQQNSFKTFWSKLVVVAVLAGVSGKVSAQSPSFKFEDFNRTNSLVIGAPAGNPQAWLETETAGSNDHRVRIENNMLVIGSQNNAAVGSSGLEQVSFDASNLYATVFNHAATELTWAFNFRQSRSGTSGFGTTTYGIAYVLGATKANFNDPDASGYAVIIGNANSPDPVKLVRFKNGLTANSNITTLISSAEAIETAYYSVKVSFEPCTRSWGLQVRNDNGAFADPATVTAPTITFADQTFTGTNLNFTGAAYNHGTVGVTAFFDNLYLPTAAALSAQPYSWTGAVSTDFMEPANWSPKRICGRATDILSFNTGTNLSLINVTSQEIGQLLITNNTTLNLRAKTGATQTLLLAGGQHDDLMLENGSALIIDSNDALEISLKTGVTGRVAGSVSVQNTVMNLGRAHRFLVADAQALIFESGSQFLARNLSGEPFGNNGAANTVIFKSNATYISRDGASPFGLASPNSKVIFETGSLYKHEQTGTAPKFDGRIYANFELNVANNLAIIFGTSAATTTRIDHFTISSGTMNVTLASGATALPMHIKGNLIVAPGATLNFNPAAVTNTSLITFNGTSNQQISGNINFGQYANLELNNPAGVELQLSLRVRGNLQFTNGLLTAAAGANLMLEDNATVTGASNASYVAGKVIKTGDEAFTFPTGKNGFYAPIAISAPLNTTDQYVAEYFQTNPTHLFGMNKADSLKLISDTEYWDLARLTGTSDVKVTLSYDPARSTIVPNPQDLRIAHFKVGNGWVNEGRSAVNATENFSFIATANFQATFSPFTFGSVAAQNTLPVNLTQFSAGNNGSAVVLSWTTASELNNERFEIERSGNGKTFEKIGTVTGQGTSSQLKRYAFQDKNPLAGETFYRLVQVDFDGTKTYSKLVMVSNLKAETRINLYPNPAQNKVTVTFSGQQEPNSIQVLNMLGQVVLTQQIKGTISETQIDLSALPAGTYFLKADQKQPAIRFIKGS